MKDVGYMIGYWVSSLNLSGQIVLLLALFLFFGVLIGIITYRDCMRESKEKNCLIETDDQRYWALHGIIWKELYPGSVITEDTWEKLHAALFKLKEYEDIGLSPEEVEQLVSLKG